MQNRRFQLPNVATGKQNERFQLQNVANGMQMEGSSSQMLQIAWKIATTRSPGKIPKTNLTMSYPFFRPSTE
jgi:hypothetical protein